jgi:hypothetical protein
MNGKTNQQLKKEIIKNISKNIFESVLSQTETKMSEVKPEEKSTSSLEKFKSKFNIFKISSKKSLSLEELEKEIEEENYLLKKKEELQQDVLGKILVDVYEKYDLKNVKGDEISVNGMIDKSELVRWKKEIEEKKTIMKKKQEEERNYLKNKKELTIKIKNEEDRRTKKKEEKKEKKPEKKQEIKSPIEEPVEKKSSFNQTIKNFINYYEGKATINMNDIKINKNVTHLEKKLDGVIKFYGKLENDKSNKTWVGVIWDIEGSGDCDGFFYNKKYFDSKPNSSTFYELKIFQNSFSLKKF